MQGGNGGLNSDVPATSGSSYATTNSGSIGNPSFGLADVVSNGSVTVAFIGAL